MVAFKRLAAAELRRSRTWESVEVERLQGFISEGHFCHFTQLSVQLVSHTLCLGNNKSTSSATWCLYEAESYRDVQTLCHKAQKLIKSGKKIRCF